ATVAVAHRYREWGRGVLLGDPELVAAQLAKARRLRLLSLYGRPQTTVLQQACDLVERGSEPVFGRQYDDRDFFHLARLGHGLQIVDPGPPFDSAPPATFSDLSVDASSLEPDDDQLRAWAEEGRVVATLLFWCGMLRELDAVPRILDVVTSTGLAAGLVL